MIMPDNEIPLALEDYADKGKWDGEQGIYDPPEFRKDHPFYRVYKAMWCDGFRLRLNEMQSKKIRFTKLSDPNNWDVEGGAA